jgi:cysteinyl-tRNA synthetase
MSPLQLYNTRARAKQTFVPADPSGQVGLFVCGPTVYDLPHLGHAKTYTQFDFLVRLLRARGFAVTYVQNITDVDDKIIRRARELGIIDASELARRYERAYLDDMRALRNDSVDVYARASDYVDQVVSQIERLQEAGAAYATADGIYFDLTAFPDYGRLSGRTNVLRGDPVSRLDANPHKRNAGDFVTIRDALATASARAIRFAFFSSHYRSPMELTDDTFSRAARALDRLDRFVEGDGRNSGAGDPGRLHDTRTAINAALDDDFDTPRALAVLFDLVREQNRYGTRKQHARALVRDFLATFALDADAGSAVVDIDVDWLIEEREEHRRNRRFADADRIRDQLAAHGVILEDSPTGVRWRRSTR